MAETPSPAPVSERAARRQPGARIGAIISSDEEQKIIKFLGYGVFECEAIPEEAVGFLAEVAREAGFTNPRLRLDNGDAVYGCECWWGTEGGVRKRIADAEGQGFTIEVVRIGDFRAAFLAATPTETVDGE